MSKRIFVGLALVPVLAGCSLFQSAPTPASAPPVVQTVVVERVVTATPQAKKCRVINDYNLLLDMDHVSTSGTQLHVEYWWEGQPERETFLPTAGVAGGRYNLTRSLRGHVWEYADCSDAEVRAQVEAHIPRRLAGGANNAGFVDWSSTGLFRPAGR